MPGPTGIKQSRTNLRQKRQVTGRVKPKRQEGPKPKEDEATVARRKAIASSNYYAILATLDS